MLTRCSRLPFVLCKTTMNKRECFLLPFFYVQLYKSTLFHISCFARRCLFCFETALLDYSVLHRSDGISYPVLLVCYRLAFVAYDLLRMIT